MELVTERLILRRWRSSDQEPFARINADSRVMRFMPSLLTREQSDAMILRAEAHFERYGFGAFAADVRSTGQLAGFIALMVPSFEAHFTPCVEIGWRLAADLWGRGLAPEGAHALVGHAFETLGLESLVSFTTEHNLPSRRVMEKLRMTHDPADDFDHPRLDAGHPLRRHVLYRLNSAEYHVSRNVSCKMGVQS